MDPTTASTSQITKRIPKPLIWGPSTLRGLGGLKRPLNPLRVDGSHIPRLFYYPPCLETNTLSRTRNLSKRKSEEKHPSSQIKTYELPQRPKDERKEPQTASLNTLLILVCSHSAELIRSLEPRINAAFQDEFPKDISKANGLDRLPTIKISDDVKTMVAGLVEALYNLFELGATNTNGKEAIKGFTNSLELVATIKAEDPKLMHAMQATTIIPITTKLPKNSTPSPRSPTSTKPP